MDFNTERPDIQSTLGKAVLEPSSSEYKMFRRNLDEIIEKNLEETGIDPRINGPPSHIKN